MHRRHRLSLALALFTVGSPLAGQAQSVPPARSLYVDSAGVIRWKDSDKEVALFGANYTLPSASDYRAAGYLGLDRKKLIDDDMAHFARMGWDGLRVCLWADWENTDRAGNLVVNDHLDLADYLIARARERGISILLTPITTYESTWPDAIGDTTARGFSRFYKKSELGTNPAAIAAQVNYIQQLLRHVNPYTGVALKDEPTIVFIEMINEPAHHSADVPGSVAYINALAEAVRSTGSKAILFHNLSQDFAIADAIAKSSVQGVTFGWYPTGLNSGHELRGSYLRTVDSYEKLRDPRIAKFPRIVYEFDSPDLRTGYMYPAMARTMRAVGTQFAAMFAYDMLGTASRNLGWQTHYLSLAYTPRKAMSAVIAAEVMRRVPRDQPFGTYPGNISFGDFRISDVDNASVLAAPDAFINAGATNIAPPRPDQLTRVAGYQSSPVVSYGGEGAYFLDRVSAGIWRLEVYPDAVPVRDPFELQSADKIVTRAISRAWPMRITLPDLGAAFTLQPASAMSDVRQVAGGEFTVTPGVYLLARRGPVALTDLPASLGALGMTEYHGPPPDALAARVLVTASPEFLRGGVIAISARVVDTIAPDSVTVFIRRADAHYYRRFPMQPSGGYDYRASIPADSIGGGPFDYLITTITRGSATTFPDGVRRRPGEWNFSARDAWHGAVVSPSAPVRLFTAGRDVGSLAFSRIGDGAREGIYRVLTSDATGLAVIHLELPRFNGRGPDDYTASLFVGDRIAARGPSVRQAKNVRIRMRAVGAPAVLHLTLVERDGSSWGAAVNVGPAWADRVVPLAQFRPVRGVMLPQGFPGDWSYWVSAPAGRGGHGDSMQLTDIERLQFSLRTAGSTVPRVEIEWATLGFD